MLSNLKKFSKDVFITLIRHISGMVLGLALSVVLARGLGVEGNGIYGMAILLPTMLATFLNLGIGPANVYFLASGKIDEATVLKTSLQLWAILSIIGIGIGYLIIYLFADEYFPGVDKHFLSLSTWIFPLVLLTTFQTSILQGLQDFRRFNFATLLTPFINLLFVIVALVVFDLEIVGGISAYLIGQMITAIVLFSYLPKMNWGQIINLNEYTKQCISYAYKAHLSNMLTFLNYRLDLFLVNFYLGPLYTGVYLVGVQIAERGWTLSHVVSTVLLPQLAELKNDEKLRKKLTPFIARWIFVVTILGAVLLAGLAKLVIGWLFGVEFLGAVEVLIWLLPGICFGAVVRVFANDIAARGKPELNFYVAAIIVAINLGLNVVLIPKLGMVGGALATSIAYFINMLFKIAVYRYITKIGLIDMIIPNEMDSQLYALLKKKMGYG